MPTLTNKPAFRKAKRLAVTRSRKVERQAMSIEIGRIYKWKRPGGGFELVEVLEGPFMFRPPKGAGFSGPAEHVSSFRVRLVYYGQEAVAPQEQLVPYERKLSPVLSVREE